MKMVMMAPMKHPRLYEAMAIPWLVERREDSAAEIPSALSLMAGNWLRKMGRVKIPPMTP